MTEVTDTLDAADEVGTWFSLNANQSATLEAVGSSFTGSLKLQVRFKDSDGNWRTPTDVTDNGTLVTYTSDVSEPFTMKGEAGQVRWYCASRSAGSMATRIGATFPIR